MRARTLTAFAVATMLFCALLLAGVWRISKARRFEAPVGNLLGDQWLEMTRSERAYFVEGYKRGSSAGQAYACDLFSNDSKNQLPPVSMPNGIVLDGCQGRARNWSKGTQQIVKEMDDFYRNPDNRAIHVTNLIQNLSDQAGPRIGQIH